MSHYELVHKTNVKVVAAMRIPEAKAVLDKAWTKLQKLPTWDETKVTNEEEVIRRAKLEGQTVRGAKLMDLCQLKNSELETGSKSTKEVWY